jgi:hypothetical protein
MPPRTCVCTFVVLLLAMHITVQFRGMWLGLAPGRATW